MRENCKCQPCMELSALCVGLKGGSSPPLKVAFAPPPLDGKPVYNTCPPLNFRKFRFALLTFFLEKSQIMCGDDRTKHPDTSFYFFQLSNATKKVVSLRLDLKLRHFAYACYTTTIVG